MRDKYTEILNCLRKHEDLGIGELNKLISILDGRLFAAEIEEKHGLVVDHSKFLNRDYVNLTDRIGIFKYGEGTRRSVGWSDDDSQPGEEYLFTIQFNTGTYIFGEDYPENIFRDFFLELKSYKPDFCDSHNHQLYWRLNNAKKINEDYASIFKKYCKINREDSKRRKIEQLQKEIEKLK